MKSTIVISILAACVAAWKYPNCEHDNCYRALIKEALQDEAKSFCFDWLTRTMTTTSSIPAEFNNCDAKSASSACSCITYAAKPVPPPSLPSLGCLLLPAPSTKSSHQSSHHGEYQDQTASPYRHRQHRETSHYIFYCSSSSYHGHFD